MSGIDAGSAYLTILPKAASDFAQKTAAGVTPALDKAAKQSSDQMAKTLEAGGQKAGEGLSNGLTKGLSAASNGLKSLGDDSKSMAEKLSSVGTGLTKSLTPVAGAVAATTGLIAGSWRSMSKEIAVQTGATGERLEQLTNSVRRVGGTVKGSIGEIGDVVSDLAAKTKLTGKPLEDLTRRILGLKELGIGISGSQVASTLGAWNVGADKMGDALERMFRIAQTTGQPMTTLLDRLTEFRPVLQSIGLSFDQASLLVSRLTDAMVPGLRKALGDIAKAGGDPKAAFDALIASIKGAATEQEALKLGVEAFGTKSAPSLVQAIRAGKFELDALAKAVDANGNSIEGTAEKYRSWADKLQMVKDKVVAAIAPWSAQIATFATIASGIGPVVAGLGKLATAAEGGSRGAQLLVGGLKGLGVGLGVASVGLATYQIGTAAAERSTDKLHRALASMNDAKLDRTLGALPPFMLEFNKLAESNSAAAGRVAASYKASGHDTSAWEKKLRELAAAQQQGTQDARIMAEVIDKGVTPAQAALNLELQDSEEKLLKYDDALRSVFGSHTGLLNSQLAVANAEAALNESIEKGTFALGHHTEAGRDGTAMALRLVDAVDAEVESRRKEAEETGKAFDRKGELIRLLEREADKYPALQEFIQQYIDKLNNIPEFKRTDVSVVTTYKYVRGDNSAFDPYDTANRQYDQARGGIMEFYAGGGTRRENHVAQIAPKGVTRVWNEPETEGEAYIPLALSKRMRSKAITEDVASRMGGDVTWHGDGSYTGPMTTTGGAPWWVGRLLAAIEAFGDRPVQLRWSDGRLLAELTSQGLHERSRARG